MYHLVHPDRELAPSAVEGEGEPAVVLAGEGRAFAAGADIAEFPDAAAAREVPGRFRRAGDALGAIPRPVIATLHGWALGGGLEIALACDLRIADAKTKVGQPEIGLGVIPGAGGTQRLTYMVGPGRARDLVYTGRQVAADEASDLGLVERVLPPDDVLNAATADARAFAGGPREALAAAKLAIRAALLTPGPEGLAREVALFRDLFGTPDQREGMRAFLEKREPRFGGTKS